MSAHSHRRPRKARRSSLGAAPSTALSVTISAALGLFASLSATTHAGDILRGGMGGGGTAPHTGGGASGRSTGSGGEQARANAQEALRRSNAAVDAVRAMQDSARAAAVARANLSMTLGRTQKALPTVPNGLVVGGLQVAPGVPKDLAKPEAGEDSSLWTGAKLPRQYSGSGRTTVVVEQTQQQAVLNWKTFNVGKQTTLKFDQSRAKGRASEWIAFNKVSDPSGVPSQILGSIEAPGQVYVINRNGIIFGGTAQINTHALVASTLPINDTLLQRGLLNQENANARFLFSGVTSDVPFTLPEGTVDYTLTQSVAAGTKPTVSYVSNGSASPLSAGTDFTFAKNDAGRTVLTFTPDGLAKVGAASVSVAYTTPSGDVVVQPGARLSAPTNAAHTGGRVALIGANVRNEGTISTPDGQTILAAGRQVGLVAHASSDPSLRGLDVFVGKVDGASGTATNSGLIEAPRGAVTMTGRAVNQLGAVDSSTSVSLNGRVDLLASFGAIANPIFDSLNAASQPFLPTQTGVVTLGASSITRILPELDSSETVVGTELALRSQINAQGRTLHLAGDAAIFAPNATVRLDAGVWAPILPAAPLAQFVHASGQIYLDSGATINVAGTTDVSVSVTQNFLDLQLRGAELADTPLQRGGLLRGIDITLDLRKTGTFNGFSYVGTPLGDASGFAGLVQRTVAQLTTAGGTVSLSAGGSVVLQSGSTIDVSGGTINFEGAMVHTTRVMSAGQILDISQATPDRIYDGLYSGTVTTATSKYGIRETFTHPLALTGEHFEPSYLQGADGGKITITAPSVALDGKLLGRVAAGERQLAFAPAVSELVLIFLRENVGDPIPVSPTPPQILFADNTTLSAANPFTISLDDTTPDLRADRVASVILSPRLLTTDGFGKLTVDNSDGDIFVPRGISLDAPVWGGVTLRAANLKIEGNVTAPSGTLDFTAFNVSPSVAAALDPGSPTPVADPMRGLFTLAAGAHLSTAGLIIDRRVNLTDLTAIDGGSISISAFNADLLVGSTVDVSGGVVVSSTGRRTYGSGGRIVIAAGRDPNANPLARAVLGGRLDLQAELSGFSGGNGGSLAIQAPQIQVGGVAPSARTFLVDPVFFSTGGFTDFTLTGLGAISKRTDATIPGLLIAPGTVIEPVAQSWLAISGEPGPNGITLIPIVRPQGLRSPVSLSFNSLGAQVVKPSGEITLIRGDIVMGLGASIKTDPRASVAISGDTVELLGSIVAPGGAISISGAGRYPTLLAAPSEALGTVHIASSSFLSTAGTLLLTPDAYGRRNGSVLPGGTISVSGNIVADAGATLDVSGSTGVLDLAPTSVQPSAAVNGSLDGASFVPATSGVNAGLWSIASVPVRIDSDAGAITLTGAQELFSDATLLGNAGGPTALGGTLAVTSGRFYAPTDPLRTPADITLIVSQTGLTRPQVAFPAGESPLGNPVLAANGSPLAALGHFSVSTFTSGGFDSLRLGGNVEFRGPVTVIARREISVASGGVLTADAAVNLTASHIILGQPFQLPVPIAELLSPFLLDQQPFAIPATFGRGSLTVTAPLIDVGNLSLQNIGSTRLIADGGDIRGDGTLDAAGDLYLRAGQVYPPTATRFVISVSDKTVTVATSTVGSETVTLASPALPPGFGVGSPLLGSTVQSVSGATVTLATGANASISANTSLVFAPGTVTVAGSGTRQLPLSAGGELDIYASVIRQGGVLRAPLGTINLGWDGTGTAPRDLIADRPVAIAQRVSLASGSVTSVSAIDPLTGSPLLIPFGLSTDGSSFIDPTGIDISAGGLVVKGINIAGQNVTIAAGSTLDIRGGGDLYAYSYLKGNGGSTDILGWNFKGSWTAQSYNESEIVRFGGAFYYARTDIPAEVAFIPPTPGAYWKQVSESFAVIPGYQPEFAPFAPFNSTVDPGYTHIGLNVGDRVTLAASSGLAAGTYTLLPARYALLPGAVLVTPQGGAPLGTIEMPEGAVLAAGYRFNAQNRERRIDPIFTKFEIASGDVVRGRSEYQEFFANDFLKKRSQTLGLPVPRLANDAGHLVLQATQTLQLRGDILARGADASSHGGLVDISSTSDILIGGPDTRAANGVLVLNADQLSRYGAESLLIGGVRTVGSDTTTVVVNTKKLTVDNAGSPLAGSDIVLVASENLTLAPGSRVVQSGELIAPAETLVLGNADAPGSGDGLLVRVSSDPDAAVRRFGITASTVPHLTIGAGARLAGTSLTLDSTFGTALAQSARLDAKYLSLNSGQITLALDGAAVIPATEGLVLGGALLRELQDAQRISLLSYSTIDIRGAGDFRGSGALSLHAGQIRGFDNAGGTAALSARRITLDNRPNATPLAAAAETLGTLEFRAGTIRIGANPLAVDQFENLELKASRKIAVLGNGGLTAQGSITATTPAITAAQASTQALRAGGALVVQAPEGRARAIASGLGATLTLEGGTSVTVTSAIVLPSGLLTLRAVNGDVTVGSRLDVSGTTATFFDLTRSTDAGEINLMADAGSVTVQAGATLSVAASAGGWKAGALSIRTPGGTFTLDGKLLGQAGAGGVGGTFLLDTASLPTIAEVASTLDSGGFTESQTIRVRTGDVLIDGVSATRAFHLSADLGAITLSGKIDASGATGGVVTLASAGDLTLLDGSEITVAAEDFSHAGKGGAIALETRTGFIDMQAGSKIDLTVAASTDTAAEQALGHFTGTLHLRAAQTADSLDVQINSLAGGIFGVSIISAEGYKVYTPGGGTISTAVQNSIRANGNIFGGNSDAITARLLTGNGNNLEPVFSVLTGAELVSAGNLTLGTGNSNSTADWNLSTFRFGPKNAPGVLTLRAAGNLVFNNGISDGFVTTTFNSDLLAPNAALPANAQTWSYRLAAGADLSAADVLQVQQISALSDGVGSLRLGKNSAPTGNTIAQTVPRLFQVIRTGSGDIDVAAGRDVVLQNLFSNIYTVGTQVADPTLGGTFELPRSLIGGTIAYGPQYTLAGGNVRIAAQGDIRRDARLPGNATGSQEQLPINWLYRRGDVDPATGLFGASPSGGNATSFGEIASTTWWVDFSNFFEGFGALGGGDVSLTAGHDVVNVDAVIPTNARAPFKDATGAILAKNSDLIELGGGDLVVRAGHDIDAGVFYTERGNGTLVAGHEITTNATRYAAVTAVEISSKENWLPTTLLLGKGNFDVSARGDVLLGPTLNPFLLPQAVNNGFSYKTTFSTYAATDVVNVASLGGSVTLRQATSLPSDGSVPGAAVPIAQAWLDVLIQQSARGVGNIQPWLTLAENGNATPFVTATSLMPATLKITAFSGDVNLAGGFNLSPAPSGTIELLAGGSINGLRPTGSSSVGGLPVTIWSSAKINLSDADPSAIPGVTSPAAFQNYLATRPELSRSADTNSDFLGLIDQLFNESGSTQGVFASVQTKQSLHDATLLHAADREPVRFYAQSGDIADLTFFAGKAGRFLAGRDVTDIGLYLQNVSEDDVSVVSAGRDIIAFNDNSPLRTAANAAGNFIAGATINPTSVPLAETGDLQISGPGTFEVLAGRNLDLGSGANRPDGTGVGLTSIGNLRNLNLPIEGANLIAGAGISGPASLAGSSVVDVAGFTEKVLTPENLDRYLPEIAATTPITSDDFTKLPEERRAAIALEIFYLVLRDAGRDHGDPSSPNFGAYTAGFDAISSLFGDSKNPGDITTQARDIRTKSGGSISLFAPGGKLALAETVIGNPQIPPGVVTEAGGAISVFTDGDVNIGISRIFTLRGGDIVIWSSSGDIAAGTSAKTVKSAPPTRVLIDPQSADVQTDLAGLATGGGIGVLATVGDVAAGDVDLIAVKGTVDAGDAGIRASGNLSIAAVQVLNANNISVSGTSAGVPVAPVVAAPNLGGLVAASNSTAATSGTADEAAKKAREQATQTEEQPSIITVEVLGYGGGDSASL